MDSQVASFVFWLPLVAALMVAVLAGIAADHYRSRKGPTLLRGDIDEERSLAAARYVIDVGDSA